MAKQRDERDQPNPESGKLQSSSDAPRSGKHRPPVGAKPNEAAGKKKPSTKVRLESAAPAPEPPAEVRSTIEPRKKPAQPTKLGPKRGAPTMLRPNDEDEAGNKVAETPVATPPQVKQPEAPAARPGRRVQPTQLAGQRGNPTMLRPADEDEAGNKLPDERQSTQTKTPPIEPVIPNLSLDDPDDGSEHDIFGVDEIIEAQPASAPSLQPAELVDAEIVDSHEPDIIEAEPISGLNLAGEPLEADVLDDDEELIEADPVSGIQPPDEEPAEHVLDDDEELIEAEPVSGIQPSSGVIDVGVLDDDDANLIEAEPVSGIQPSSGVIAGEVLDDADDDLIEAEPVSGIQPSSGIIDAGVLEDEEPGLIEAEPVSGMQSYSGILSGEELGTSLDDKSSDDDEINVLSDEHVASPLADEETGPIDGSGVISSDAPPSDVALADLEDELAPPPRRKRASATYGLAGEGSESGIFGELQRQSQADDFLFSDTPPPGQPAPPASVEEREQDLFLSEQNLQLADELAAAGFVDHGTEEPEAAADENVFAEEEDAPSEPVSAPSNIQFAELAAEIEDTTAEPGQAEEAAEEEIEAGEPLSGFNLLEESETAGPSSSFALAESAAEEFAAEEISPEEEMADEVLLGAEDAEMTQPASSTDMLADDEVIEEAPLSGLNVADAKAPPSGFDLFKDDDLVIDEEAAEEVLSDEIVDEEKPLSGLDLVQDEVDEEAAADALLDDEEVGVAEEELVDADEADDLAAHALFADDEEVVAEAADEDVVDAEADEVIDADDDEELIEAADEDLVEAEDDELVEAEADDDLVADDVLVDEEVVEAADDDVVGAEDDEEIAADALFADEDEPVEAAEDDDLVEAEADEELVDEAVLDDDEVFEAEEELVGLEDAEDADAAGVGDVLFDESDEEVVAEEEEVLEALDDEVDEEAFLEDDAEVAEEAVDEDEMVLDDDKPSGIDSIAEELESGLALNKRGNFDDDIDLSELSVDDESSEVDLGSLASKKNKKKKGKEDSNIFGVAEEEAVADADEFAVADEELLGGSEEEEALAEEAVEDVDLDDLADDDAVAEEAEEEAVAEQDADEAAADFFGSMDDEAVAEEEAVDEEAVAEEDSAYEAAEDDAYGEEAPAYDDAYAEEPVEEMAAAAPPARRRRGAAPPADYDDDDSRGRRRPRKPKYARRWFGGFMLATIAVVGAAIAMWYFNPDQLEELLMKVPASPNAKAGFFSSNRGSALLTPLQKAREHINKGEYNDAVTALNNRNEPDELATRGEARWLMYLKKQMDSKLPLDPKDQQVQLALADVDSKPLLKKQIQETLNYDALMQKVNTLQGAEKLALGLLDTFVKANVLPNQSEIKDLPTALDKTLTEKKLAEQTLDQFKKSLVDGKVIDMNDNLDAPKFQVVVNNFNGMRQLLDTIQQKLLTANIKDTPDKGVEQLLTLKKDAEDKLSAFNKTVADAGAKDVKEVIDTRDKLAKERTDLDTLVKGAFTELQAGKFVAENADPRKDLLEGIKMARSKAESPIVIPLSQVVSTLGNFGAGAGELMTRGFDSTAAAAELNFYRVREPFVQGPEVKLDTWARLLQNRDYSAAKELADATRDADYVRSPEAKASADARAKALFVQGLALRNQEKFAEAKDSLKTALDEANAVKLDSPWTKSAGQALAELTDPSAYFMPRITRLEQERSYKLALQEADVALRAIPDNGPLLAQRSLIRLELASGQGEIPAEVQQSIREDALAAQKDMASAAAGHYALGRLEEALDNLDEAEKQYRAALAAHKGTANEASRYRVALTRLLLRDPERRPRFPANQEDAGAKKLGAARVTPGVNSQSLQTFFALALTGVQFEFKDENPLADKRIKESIDFANELIQSDDPKIQGQGYMLLGQAHALQGERTKGLKEYIKGLQLVFPGRETKELMVLIDRHPAFQQPDTLVRPNPFLAEQHFGKGLHHYWSEEYPKAEEYFQTAIGYFGQDARYYSSLVFRDWRKTQAKRDGALYALEKGARLEAENRPGSTEVNASLERIQGDLRQTVNGFRQRGLGLGP